MSQNYYDIYLNDTISLVETLVIKSDYTADQINTRMSLDHGPGHFEPLDKATWKYYLNMSGQYHPLDAEIQITSLDTLQTIAFSKQNLQTHRATAQAYQYGSRYYRELVSQYPQSEDLILGVLYPVDIDKAIEAPDMQVVGYPSHLIEENEVSLLKNINEWLEHFDIRWNNKQFVHSDELYMASVLGLAALNLVPVILNLRLKACRTAEVHSFHVRQYLASNGMLDTYLDQMTRKQALFFYRNISYIERNAGKQKVFEWLIQKVMTDRQLPLSEFTMKHDASVMPESLTPAVTFRKRLINTEVQSMDRQENYQTLEAILNKEQELAPGNREYRMFNQARINTLFEGSLSSTIATKVLESSMVDYTDAVPITLHRILLSNWLYLSNTNRFNVLVRISDPRNGETITLNAKQAYLYYMYAFCKASGLPVESVPSLLAERVHCEPSPTTMELLAIVDTKYVSLEDVVFMKSLHPPLRSVQSVADFQDHAQELHTAALAQTRFVANQEHHFTRGLMHNVMLRLHSDTVIEHETPGERYLAWLTANELPYDGYTEDDWTKIYKQVYEEVTGAKLDLTESVGNLQRAMVSLLAKLSSYSVQFVTEINSASIQIMNWAAIRLGDMSSYGKNFQNVLISALKFKRTSFHADQHHVMDLEPIFNDFSIRAEPQDMGPVEVPIHVAEKPYALFHRHPMHVGHFSMDNRWYPEGATLNSWDDVPNFSGFVAMTPEEKSEIKSIYHDCFPAIVYPTHADIGDLLLHDQVPGFGYLQARRNYLNMFRYFYAPAKTYLFLSSGIEVELDGFYSNHGELDSSAFELNTGHQTAESFKWEGALPTENVFDSFVMSGGYTFSEHFNAVFKDDEETVLPGLYAIHHTASPSIMPFYSSVSVDLFKGTTDARDLPQLQQVRESKDIGTLKGLYGQGELPGFKGSTSTFSFSFVNTYIHDEISNLMISPVEDSKELPGLRSTYAAHSVTSTKGMSESRTLPGLNNVTYAHNSRGVRQWFGVVASLDTIDTVYATRSLDGFKNVLTTRALPSFRIVMHQRSLNAFNWLLGSGDHDVTVRNSYSWLAFSLKNTMHAVDLTLLSLNLSQDMTDMVPLFHTQELVVENAAVVKQLTGLRSTHHVWDLMDIANVEADERDLSDLFSVYEHGDTRGLEGLHASRTLTIINEHALRDELVTLLSSHDIREIDDIDPPEPTPTPEPTLPPELELSQPQNFVETGDNYNHQFTTSGGQAPYAYEVISGTLPTGLTLTSAGLLSGTVTQAAQTDATFVIRSTDANGATGTRGVTINVIPPAAQQISNYYSHGVANLEGHESYYTAPELQSPVTWSIAGGSLPNGLHLGTLDVNFARIWGVPDADVGEYTATLRAQGADGEAQTWPVKFAVADMLHLLHFNDNIIDQTDKVWTQTQTALYENGESGFGKKLRKNSGYRAQTTGIVLGSDFAIDFRITMAAPLGGAEQYAWVVNQDNTNGPRPWHVIVDTRTNTFWFSIRNPNNTASVISLTHALPTGTTAVRVERSGTTGRIYFSGIKVQETVMPEANLLDTLKVGEVNSNALTYGLFDIDELRIVKGASQAMGESSYAVPKLPSNYPQPARALSIRGSLPGASLDQPYSSLTDITVNGTPTSVAILDVSPLGLSAAIVGNHVEVTGTPTQAGTYTFRLRVTDASNNVAILPVTLIVTEDPSTHPDTVSYLRFDGSNASTTVSDDVSSRAWTAAGGAQLRTTHRMFGGTSLYLPGTSGSYVTTPNTTDYQLGAGDFTIAVYVFPTGTGDMTIVSNWAGVSANYCSWLLYRASNGKLTLSYGVASSNVPLASTGLLVLNKWQHIAVVREGTTLKLYIDKVLDSTHTLSGTLNYYPSEPIVIGACSASSVSDGSLRYTGYIDNLLIAKAAHQISTFAEPIDNGAISRLRFEGANGATSVTDDYGVVWTREGEAVISTAQAHTGASSLYLPNATKNDAFTAPANIITTAGASRDPFIIRGWFYTTKSDALVVSEWLPLVSQCGSGANADQGLSISNGGKISYTRLGAVAGGASSLVGTTVVLGNQWYKFAMTYDGTTRRLYLNDVLEAEGTDNNSGWSNTGQPLRLGRYVVLGYEQHRGGFVGYIDDFEIIKTTP